MNKKYASILLFLCIFILVGCSNGKATFEDLKSLDNGIDSAKVLAYLGEPKSKTINKEEIFDWAPDNIVENRDSYPELEMYVYKMEDGNEAHLFFSKDKLIFKKPIGLNQ